MRSGVPKVTDAGDGPLVGCYSDGSVVVGAVVSILKNDVDLCSFETDDREVEIDIQIREKLELASQDVGIPNSDISELVVSDDEGALLGLEFKCLTRIIGI